MTDPWRFPPGPDARAALAVATYRRDHADRFRAGLCEVCEADAEVTTVTLTYGPTAEVCPDCIENGLVLGVVVRRRGGWLAAPDA